MIDNVNEYEQEVLEHYSELVKVMYLKETMDLGINARNKVIANYNRMVQAEKVAQINSLITKIGNAESVAALSNLMYISTQDPASPLLRTYATVKVYLALKSQILGEEVDPLHIISSFDPNIWQHENIQDYANAALEYNKYDAMLSNAMKRINEQTKVKQQ